MKVLDTNVVIYHVKGQLATPLSGDDFQVSLITELETLGYPGLDAKDEVAFRAFFATIEVVNIDSSIKRETIRLRRTTRLRLPDAIIAATALTGGFELLTHDASLLKIPNLLASAPPLK